MNNKQKDFDATEFSNAQGASTRQVTSFNGSMAICLDNGIVVITKQQAMKFFELSEA